MLRTDMLRNAMLARASHLRDIAEKMHESGNNLLSLDAPKGIPADRANQIELEAFRTFFDSFVPEPIRVEL